MLSDTLGAVDWPFAALLAFFVFMSLSWPQYRRLTREMHFAAAEGDHARALDAALAIRHSRNPVAILERLLSPGDQQAIVAIRYVLLGEFDDAMKWAELALKKARRHRVRVHGHYAAALVCSWRADLGQMDWHLRALESLLARRPVDSLSPLYAAIYCNQQAGRLDEVERILRAQVFGTDALRSTNIRHAAVWGLLSLGRFDEVLQLTAAVLRDASAPAAAADPVKRPRAEAGTGIQRLKSAANELVQLDMLLAGAEAAAAAQRWDEFEAYVAAPALASSGQPSVGVAWRADRMMLAAHRDDSAEMARHESEIAQLLAAHPRNRRLPAVWACRALRAWQIAGDHQRAMAAARTVWEDPLVPIERSELAAGMAKSLAALGRPEESDRLRAEAFALAPGAHWNHERRASTTALPQESGEAILPTEAYVAAPAAESGPVEPVASPVACAVWIMAVFAMVPVFGMPAGIALLVLSILLIAKRQPLPHDRRVGRAGLIAAVVSLAFALVSIPSCASAVLARLAQDRHAEQNREATQAEDESSESDEENETGASAPAAGPSARTADRQPADSHVPWHQTAIYLGVLAVSIVLHEIGHAIAAFWSGDPTARNLGRFSLNPVRHFSWVGSLIVPAALTLIHSDAVIGWAKPVPIRQERFRHPRRGLLGVTLAGVSLNMLIALIATNLMLVLLLGLRWAHADASFGNLIFPFQMVEVSGVPSGTYWAMALSICKAAVWINAFLTGFNLLPFPPLDGFGVIRALAPAALTPLLNKVTGIGMILMLALIAFKALTYLLLPGILLGLLLLSYVQFITA